jgi:hypothetical protein
MSLELLAHLLEYFAVASNCASGYGNSMVNGDVVAFTPSSRLRSEMMAYRIVSLINKALSKFPVCHLIKCYRLVNELIIPSESAKRHEY